jgi:KDO2-lipid IV(A) lauroyltransferase
MESAKTFGELGYVWHRPAGEILSLIRGVEGQALLDEAFAEGRGVILATPHLGNWEVAGLFIGSLGPTTILYRPPRMGGLDALIRDVRARAGAQIVPTDASGVKALMHALGRKEIVGLLPDHEPRRGHGAFAPFFGVPAYSMVLIGRLASRRRVPVVLGYAQRLPRGRGFHMKAAKPDEDIYSRDPGTSAAALNRCVETLVRECPEQYQWSYKRFKTRPEGERQVYG